MDPNSVNPYYTHLYTVVWRQPYATELQRPFLRSQQQQLESCIEAQLSASTKYPDAKKVIDRIKAL